MRILFIGLSGGVIEHRCRALRRLGHQVHMVDERQLFPNDKIGSFWSWHTGLFGLECAALRRLQTMIPEGMFDAAWLDTTVSMGPLALKFLRSRANILIHYNHDDPFGNRDGQRWRLLRQAVKMFDLFVVVRRENVEEAKALGAKRVMHVFRSADEVEHSPRVLTPDIYEKWRSDVLFVGTWFPERGPFMTKLIERGVPLTLIGGRWNRSPEWPQLKSHWRAPEIHGEEYAFAIQSAKICLGLLSRGNRDLHTTRSLEIPSLGSLFCAERTREHLELYHDGTEAIFWDSAEECAERCLQLLGDPGRRESIARQGRARFFSNGTTNENSCRRILEAAFHSEYSIS